MITWYSGYGGREMEQTKEQNNQSLVDFFEGELAGSEEEIKSIIEIQRIVEEILGLEERPQIYQLKVTSNW